MKFRLITIAALIISGCSKPNNASLDQLYKEAYQTRISNPGKSELLLDEYLQLANDNVYLGAGYFLQGEIYESQNKLHLALTSYFNSYKAYKAAGNREKNLSQLCKSIGSLFFNTMSYGRALEYFRESNDYAIKNDVLASNYYNLGITFRRTNQIDSALHYLEKSTFLRRELNDWTGVIKNYNELGLIGLDLDDNKLARYYFNESLKMIDPESQSEVYSWVVNNLGLIALEEKEFVVAESFFQESLRYMDSTSRNLPVLFNNLADIAFIKGDTSEGVKYLKTCIQRIDYHTDPEEITSAYNRLIDIYHNIDLESSLIYSRKLNDFNMNANKRSRDFEIAAQKYRLELIDLEFKTQIKLEHQRMNTQRIIVVVLFIILLLISLFLIWLRDVKRRAHNQDGNLLKMVKSDVKFYVEMLLYENAEKQKTIDEYRRDQTIKKNMTVSKRPEY